MTREMSKVERELLGRLVAGEALTIESGKWFMGGRLAASQDALWSLSKRNYIGKRVIPRGTEITRNGVTMKTGYDKTVFFVTDAGKAAIETV